MITAVLKLARLGGATCTPCNAGAATGKVAFATSITALSTFNSTTPEPAAFISLITGTAGNAGTQALALAVRRIAVGSDKNGLRDFFSEVIAGILVGIATGLSVFIVVALWKQNVVLGFAVGLAMTIAIIVANLAGYLIPVVIDKIGFDPAVASGPFITTLSDLTSVLIYFNVAQLFITHFIGG